ncbi:MAG: hypothetical protein HYZ69_00410 [Candidatus Colwellbacteria bacterium]|nr:hypothetical protein [Candidatus Colwellbacteria bacterium]
MSQWTLGAVTKDMQQTEKEDAMTEVYLIIEGNVVPRITHLADALGVPIGQLVHELLDRALRGHNQTKEEWLEKSTVQDLGTGVFLVPDVTSKSGSVKKVFVPDITYTECIQRGQAVVAFQWVPHSIAITSYETLAESACSYGPADKD